MKGKKIDHAQADCGIARSLHVVGDWWSLLIVREAFAGRERFGEFEKALGVAKNILSTRLKKLVEEGILEAVPDADSPSRNRYVLSAKGEQLHVVLMALWQWGERHCFEGGKPGYAMVDTQDLRPIAGLELRAQDGRVLGPRDFRRVPWKDLPGVDKEGGNENSGP